MRGARGILALGAAMLILPTPAIAGGPVQIDVEDTFFTPSDHSDTVASGQTINWSWGPGDTNQAHSVHQLAGIFDSGSPSGAGNYTIEPSAGTYQYFCENHSGMTGVLRFGMPTPAVAPDGTFPVTWATATSTPGNLNFHVAKYDVQYRRATGEWKRWLVKTPKLTATFGKNGKPLAPKLGKTYELRARTRVGEFSIDRSDWSPQLTVTVPG